MIADYEVDFPTATSHELALYSSGLQLFPQVVLEMDHVWGRLRRVGVVDIDASDYEEIIGVFATQCLSPGFLAHMTVTMNGLIGQLGKACDTLGEGLASGNLPGPDMFEKATELMARLMAFHVLNWALPIEEILALLRGITGTRAAAREALLGLIVPFTSSHILDGLASDDKGSNALRLALPQEVHPQRVAYRTLSIWLQSRGDASDLAFLTNLARLGRLAAEEEEQRRRIQNRWIAIASKWVPEPHRPEPGDLDVAYTAAAILPENNDAWGWLSDARTRQSR